MQGKLEDLKPGEFGVVLGDITARRFRLSVGDKITLIVPEASTAPGGITPRLQRLNVVGIFKVGAELDGSMGLVNMADAATIQLDLVAIARIVIAINLEHRASLKIGRAHV